MDECPRRELASGAPSRAVGASLLLAGIHDAPTASAHNWACWRQPDRTVRTYNTASRRSEANAAIADWDSKTILALPQQSSHTDISVFDGNYGNTGWGGLASIESSSGCTILHGHARVNLYYSYTSNGIRGIFCQEVGHLFGLDHSNDGGCMGGGYFYSINSYYSVVSHNVSDISSKYSGVPALADPGDHPGEAADRSSRPTARAFWHSRPSSLVDAAKLANAVVVARVTAVSDGADLEVKADGLAEGVDRIPTQRVSFDVERTLAGHAGASFELFHTGNASYVVDEDAPYHEGQSYLLFVTARDDGSYRVVSPDGRLRVTDRGLEPSAHEGFSTFLRGAGLEAVEADLAELARKSVAR